MAGALEAGGTRHARSEAPLRSRRALLIAYHYPPCGTSSGLQRTLCFSRDLRGLGWSPTVLTAHARAYREVRYDQISQIPSDVSVHRAFALDTLRHLGFRGRYVGWMALPDPWVTWFAGALPVGLRLIHRLRPDVIWSTYPMATAHLIGLALHHLTGIPWIADFRDPMTEIDPITRQRFPTDARLWSVRRWVERQAIQHCQRAIFVTPAALQIHRERYPERAADMRLIENGYDEENFAAAERTRGAQKRESEPLLLVHSGTLYPGPDRDASGFLAALAQLRSAGVISSATLRVRLRATGYDDIYRERIAQHGVADMVTLEPTIPTKRHWRRCWRPTDCFCSRAVPRTRRYPQNSTNTCGPGGPSSRSWMSAATPRQRYGGQTSACAFLLIRLNALRGVGRIPREDSLRRDVRCQSRGNREPFPSSQGCRIIKNV